MSLNWDWSLHAFCLNNTETKQQQVDIPAFDGIKPLRYEYGELSFTN
jgi:hypothetical protein